MSSRWNSSSPAAFGSAGSDRGTLTHVGASTTRSCQSRRLTRDQPNTIVAHKRGSCNRRRDVEPIQPTDKRKPPVNRGFCSEGGTRTRDTTKATDAPGVFPRNPKTSNDHGLARDSLRERMLPKRLYSGRLGTPRVSSSAYSLNKRARIKSRRAHRRPLSNTAVLRNSCGPDTYVFGHPSGLHP